MSASCLVSRTAQHVETRAARMTEPTWCRLCSGFIPAATMIVERNGALHLECDRADRAGVTAAEAHAARKDCRCTAHLIRDGVRYPSLRFYLEEWAPLAPRCTPKAWWYPNRETFLLEHGSTFSLTPLTNDDRMYVWDCLRRAQLRPTMGQCYRNSRRALVLGDFDHRLQYVEGLVGDVAIAHGWLLLDGTKVVDLTLGYRAAGVRLHVPPSARFLGPPDGREDGEYFGVELPRELVEAEIWASSYSFLDVAPRWRPELLRTPWEHS